MTPFFVADIGNSRIKCGRANADGLLAQTAIDPASPQEWDRALHEIEFAPNSEWLVAGVEPSYRDSFVEWLAAHSAKLQIIADFRDVPIKLDVERPDRVGIDRLLLGLAASHRVGPQRAVAVISAGTAVTVDLVNRHGVFAGGTILPGFQLMGRALKDYTAQLPHVRDFDVPPNLPGRDTEAAIRAGIHAAIAGGIDRIVETYRVSEPTLAVFATGGDAARIGLLRCAAELVGPYLALDGLRLCRVLKR